MALQTQSSKSPLSLHTVANAVDELLQWLESQAKPKKSQLLKHDYLYLVLTLVKIPPKVRTNPYTISLPNPLYSFDYSKFCLIIDDRPKSSLTAEAAKKKIQSEKIPISKVVKFSKLNLKYSPYSYDLSFIDKRIAHLLPRWLRNDVFKNKVPVDLKHKNGKEQMESACGSALLFLATRTRSVLKVGRVSQGRDAIVANVIATIDGVAELVPNKWGGIRSFCLKFPDSLALPVYEIVPEIGLKIENVKKEKGEKKVDSQAELGEKSRDAQVLDDIYSGKEVDDKENKDKSVELDNFELKVKKRKVEKLKKKEDAISFEVKDIFEVENVADVSKDKKESAKIKDIGEDKEAEEEPNCVLIEEDDEKEVWVRCNQRFYNKITVYKEDIGATCRISH